MPLVRRDFVVLGLVEKLALVVTKYVSMFTLTLLSFLGQGRLEACLVSVGSLTFSFVDEWSGKTAVSMQVSVRQ